MSDTKRVGYILSSTLLKKIKTFDNSVVQKENI